MTTKHTHLILLDTDGNEHWLVCISQEQIVTARGGVHFIWARESGRCVSVDVDDLQLTPASLNKAALSDKQPKSTGLTVLHGGKPVCAKAILTFELQQLSNVVRTLFIDGDMLRNGMHFRNYPDAAGFCRNIIKPNADTVLDRLVYLGKVTLDLADAPVTQRALKRIPQPRETKE